MKTAIATILLLLLIITVEAAGWCRGELLPGNGTMAGKIIDGESGTPLQQVRVEIVPADTSMLAAIGWDLSSGLTLGRLYTTGRDGSFIFSNLMVGSYTIRATKTPYVTVQQTDVRIESTAVATVSIRMVKHP